MTAVSKTIYIEQGATFRLPFLRCLAGPDDVDGNPTIGDPISSDGREARLQIRSDFKKPAIITATSLNGDLILGYDLDGGPADPDNGRIFIHLPADMTNLLDSATLPALKGGTTWQRSGVYDLELYDPNDLTEVDRILEGPVIVELNVTRDD